MTAEPKPFNWYAAPESLEAKFKLLHLLALHPGVRGKHNAVLSFIFDWYMKDRGNALASVRHIVSHLNSRNPFGGCIYAGDVHSALADLVAWGFLTQEKGIGRRASRYVPVWDLLRSVREITNATGGGKDELSVREHKYTCVRENQYTTARSVSESPNEDPSTGPGEKTRGTVERDIPAAPSAPLASRPTGAEAAVSAGGFESLWIAYGHRQKKAEAKAAYKKLNPDAEMQARLVEAATAWRMRWEEQNNPQAARYTLSKWLEREEFECDPPVGYKTKAPKARNDNRPAKADKTTAPKPDFTVIPDRRQIGTIVKVNDGSDEFGERFLEIVFEAEGGAKFEDYITYESPNLEDQRHGQEELRHLADVVGIGALCQADDLLGGVVELTISQTGSVKSIAAVRPAA